MASLHSDDHPRDANGVPASGAHASADSLLPSSSAPHPELSNALAQFSESLPASAHQTTPSIETIRKSAQVKSAPRKVKPSQPRGSINKFVPILARPPVVAPPPAPLTPTPLLDRLLMERLPLRSESVEQLETSTKAVSEPRGVKRKIFHGHGRPRKADEELKRARPNPRAKPTRLHSARPVKQDLPHDIWHTVFLFTDSKTLLGLFGTCKAFNEILSRESLWKELRERELGLECPPPPPSDMSERRYAQLLFGKGCMECGAYKTQKTPWPFDKRWCKSCFRAKTTMINPVTTPWLALGMEDLAVQCLPCAIVDAWGAYLRPGEYDMRSEPALVYLKNDLEDLSAELESSSTIETAVREAKDKDSESKWSKMRDACAAKMRHAYDVYNFLNTYRSRWSKIEERVKSIKVRSDYFEKQAMELDPPLTIEVMRLIPAFQIAIKGKSVPTERVWNNLLQKLIKDREAAEKQVDAVNAALQRRLDNAQMSEPLARMECRKPILLDIVASVIKDLLDSNVAAADVYHVAIRDIWDNYHALPHDERDPAQEDDVLKDPTTNAHVLSMWDLAAIYIKIDNVLRAAGWDSRRRKVAALLKCPCCTRKDYSKAWTLSSLLLHLSWKHGQQLGSEFGDYYIKTLEVSAYVHSKPWMALPWPKNPPFLARHQVPAGRWDPNTEGYERKPPGDEDDYDGIADGHRSDMSPADQDGGETDDE